MGVSRRQVANRAASGSDNFVQIEALTVNAKVQCVVRRDAW